MCSVSCLDGWKTRHVSCIDANGNEVSDEQCLKQGEARPQSHQPCNQGPCPFWRTSDWTKVPSFPLFFSFDTFHIYIEYSKKLTY